MSNVQLSFSSLSGFGSTESQICLGVYKSMRLQAVLGFDWDLEILVIQLRI